MRTEIDMEKYWKWREWEDTVDGIFRFMCILVGVMLGLALSKFI